MTIVAGQAANASDFVSTSAGASDSGKVPKLNGSGLLDTSFIPPEYQSRLKSYSVIENMNGSTTPVAVCVNSGGTVQKGEADQTGTIDKFIGFCKDNITTVSPSFLNTSSADNTGVTLSFTPNAGNNKVIIVQVAVRRVAGANLPTNVTWNGLTMTLVDSQLAGASHGHALYVLPIGSVTTTANVSVTVGAYDQIHIQAMAYDNVHQTTPTLIKAKATGTSATASVTLDPTQLYSTIINVMTPTNGGISSWNDGQTQRASCVAGFSSYSADVVNKTGASVVYDASLGASYVWGMQAVELQSIASAASNIQISGNITFSGLTPNAKYYLQNTAGDIGTSAGGTSVLVGKALSTTELLIIQN